MHKSIRKHQFQINYLSIMWSISHSFNDGRLFARAFALGIGNEKSRENLTLRYKKSQHLDLQKFSIVKKFAILL